MTTKEIISEKAVASDLLKIDESKKVGNNNLKLGKTRYVVRIKNKPKKMEKLSNQEKIKLIKNNLFMRTDKLAKKAGFNNISSLYQFCSRNKISLSPNKHILNYIKKNIDKTSISFMKKITGYTKQDLYNIMGENGISTEKFRGVNQSLVKVINTKTKTKSRKTKSKISKDDEDDIESKKEIVYEKVSHEHLNGILMSYDKVAQSFLRDLEALSVGEALCIKKENWTLKISPFFYLKKILSNSPMKARVKELNEDYYVIRLK